MKQAYLYTRVSTDEQAKEGFSIDNQKRACMEYAQMYGYHVKRAFEDEGRSGRSTDRPAFQELLSVVKEHPVDAVIIYKIDRFARNVGDFSTIRKQFKDLSIKLLSVSENGDVTEGLIGNIFASVAEWESEVNGQRTRDALMQKYREGWQPTPPPIGYRSVGGERERKTCEPDPYTASIIKELFELYATGSYSILEVQDWLSDKDILSRNGTGLGHSVIHTILNNPFYYGLIRWRGQSKMGNHLPIISKDLYDTCQYVLGKHRNFLLRKRTHDFLLRGFAYCEDCEQRYTAEWHKHERFTKHKGKIAYYHCQKRDRNGCPSPYVEMGDLEKLAAERFKEMQFSQEFIDAIVIKAKEKLAMSRKVSGSQKQAIMNQKTGLETKRNRLEDAMLDGTIDRETFKRKHTEMQARIKNLDADLQNIDEKCNLDVELIEEVLAFSRNIYETYMEAPPFLKRHYLRFFYEKLMIEKKKIVRTVPTPIFLSLLENHAVIIRQPQLRD